MNKYLNFCKKCMKRKMDPTKNYYVLESDKDFEKIKTKKNNLDVLIVCLTQAAVDQGKSEVREEMDINIGKKRKIFK